MLTNAHWMRLQSPEFNPFIIVTVVVGFGDSHPIYLYSISEENFWRNYFYRVSLLRQGYELNAMARQQEESNPNQTLASDSIDHTQGT